MPAEQFDWAKFLEAADHAATVCGVVIGGGWVYFNAFRGRIFTPRLATKVTVALRGSPHHRLILIRCEIRNTGLRKVTLHRESTVVSVSSLSLHGQAKFLRSAREQERRTFPIAQRHAYLEPGSTVHDAVLLFLPPKSAEAFRIELVVAAHSQRWTASEVVVDEAWSGSTTDPQRNEKQNDD